MRVSELANELGKTSKEILEIIKTKDKSAVLYAASNVTKDQENIVRSFANPKRDAKPAAPEHRTEAPKTEASRTEAPRTEAPKTEAPKAEAARNQDGGSKGEPAKKKLTAVFRPQNSSRINHDSAHIHLFPIDIRIGDHIGLRRISYHKQLHKKDSPHN